LRFVGYFQRPFLTRPQPAVYVLENLTSGYCCLTPSGFFVGEFLPDVVLMVGLVLRTLK
jgi:hypothetical protein